MATQCRGSLIPPPLGIPLYPPAGCWSRPSEGNNTMGELGRGDDEVSVLVNGGDRPKPMDQKGNAASLQDPSSSSPIDFCEPLVSFRFFQKIMAELIGTYFLIFAGCASVTVNLMRGTVTLPGIGDVWGLVVMLLVYALGHVSGAHFNPAVSIALATSGRFPWKQVPSYCIAQVLGSGLASGTLRLLFGGQSEHYPGTIPTGSDVQSLVMEFIITFHLLFVVSAVATDDRAIKEFGGLAVGATVHVCVLIAGPISGASLNPARSLGPAIVANRYDSIWVYVIGPICGAITGAWAYNLVRFTEKPPAVTA